MSTPFRVRHGIIVETTVNNASVIVSNNQVLSGSGVTPIVDLATTWNTTGNPTAIKLNVTNTTSGANSALIDLQVGGNSRFYVAANGNLGIGNTTPVQKLRVEGDVSIVGNTIPAANVTYDLGTDVLRWKNVYSSAIISDTGSFGSNVSIGGTLSVSGNLTVTGNVTVIGANNLSIVDNFIYLNSNNTTQNMDLGFAGNYNDGVYKHAGFFRDASDGYWKVFDGYLPEPDAAVDIDTSNNTFNIANFWTNTLRLGNTSTYATINSSSYSGAANSSLYANGSISNTFTVGTAAYFVANSNVGIGNTAPASKLVIQDTLTANASSTVEINPTWNATANTFTALRVNATDTASNAASLLVDLQVGGSSKFKINKSGIVTLSSTDDFNPGIYLSSAVGIGSYVNNSFFVRLSSETPLFLYNGGASDKRVVLGTNYYLGFNGSGGATASPDLILTRRGAANIRFGAADTGAVTSTVTITIATPGVVTLNTHGLSTGTPVVFTTTGALPTGITAGTTYYVVVIDTNNFQLATSVANAISATPTVIATSGTQSGTHTATRYNITQRLSMQGVTGVTDRLGADLFIQGSQGTGTGAGGSIIFQVAPVGSTGSTQNALATALTINSSRQILTDLFNTTTPALAPSGSTNSGISFSGSNGSNLRFYRLGTATAIISSTFGINSSYPFSWSAGNADADGTLGLALYKDVDNVLALRNGTNAQTSRIYGTFTDASNYERLSLSANSTAAYVQSEQAGTGTARPLFLGANNTTAAAIAANGNVGIGNTAPTEKLVIQGNIRFESAAYITGGAASSGNNEIIAGVDTSGFYYAGGNSRAPNTIPVFIGGTTGDIRFRTIGNLERVRFAANGNVGIGNTTPDAKLTVTGTANVSGNVVIGGITTLNANLVLGSSGLSANGSFGTAGQTLTSNGSSTYWASAASTSTSYSANVGNNSNTTFVITHNLNTRNIYTSVREISSGYFVYPDIKYTSNNDIQLEFVNAPTTNQYYLAILTISYPAYSANVGNNSNTTFVITHALNTQNIVVSVRDISSGYYIYPDIKYNSNNDIQLEFVTAPTTNQYYVAVFGGG